MMQQWQKIAASLWTTLLITPILAVAYGYSTASCLPTDPCSSDGGPMPYRDVAIALMATIVVLQLAFLRMVWKSSAIANLHHSE